MMLKLFGNQYLYPHFFADALLYFPAHLVFLVYHNRRMEKICDGFQ